MKYAFSNGMAFSISGVDRKISSYGSGNGFCVEFRFLYAVLWELICRGQKLNLLTVIMVARRKVVKRRRKKTLKISTKRQR